MCSLCASMGGGSFWTDAAGLAPFEGAGERVTPRHERARRVQLVNLVLREYGLLLRDWSGSAYVLEARSGAQEIVHHLNGIWAAAERMAGRVCDPLEPEFVQRIAQFATDRPR